MKKFVSLLLALVMCLSLLPVTATAAKTELPDWYFLIAIFKNVDADGKDKDGKDVHIMYSMTQDEIKTARDYALAFETYMDQLGVIQAHVEVVEIDKTVTELEESEYDSYIGAEQAAPLLRSKVDLDRYDHVTCITSLGIATSYGGITSSEFENGTGESCINFKDRENCLQLWAVEVYPWVPGYPVHEFLHFMERMNKKWGKEFGLHDIMENFYERVDGEFEECYTDILLNRAKGTAGTGVYPAAWQYPPHVLRVMTELTVPSDVTCIGEKAFQSCTNLSDINIHSGVTEIGVAAFEWCTSLEEVTIPSGVASVGDWAFQGCTALSRVTIPASIVSIGYAAFYNSSLTDIYYGGTETQWRVIQMGEYNETLTNANIHYNSLIADVKTTDWFAEPVAWALENGVTSGTGSSNFSPSQNCTVAQILTFLWRASSSPKTTGNNPFSDVKSGDYFYDAALWAAEKGMVSDVALNGNAACTRSMAVTYMWKAAGSPSARTSSFTDVPTSADYAGAVA